MITSSDYLICPCHSSSLLCGHTSFYITFATGPTQPIDTSWPYLILLSALVMWVTKSKGKGPSVYSWWSGSCLFKREASDTKWSLGVQNGVQNFFGINGTKLAQFSRLYMVVLLMVTGLWPCLILPWMASDCLYLVSEKVLLFPLLLATTPLLGEGVKLSLAASGLGQACKS